MIYKIPLFVLIVSLVGVIQINGQPCVPSSVQNFVLYDNFTLSWKPSPNELCSISHYLVYVSSSPNDQEHVYLTSQTELDVGHLPDCTSVWVTIVPISSENVEGESFMTMTKTPPVPGFNLNISYIRLSALATNVVFLQWDVEDQQLRCLRGFRFVSYNENDDVIYTVYSMYDYIYLRDIIPCTSYVFTVEAVYNLETEGRVTVLRYTSSSTKIAAPALQSISPGTTTIDLTWRLQEPSINRCPVNALIVDSSPYFNISYAISGQDQINRLINTRLTGLQSDTMYWLRVSANNTAGPSDPFILAVQTLATN